MSRETYRALATDFDATLADRGRVAPETVTALDRLRAHGRHLFLVTGRELPDLRRVFGRLDLFERVIAENGGLLYRPATNEEIPLAMPPPAALVRRLRALDLSPLSIGRVVIATTEPHHRILATTIAELGLDHRLTFNKGSVMALPAGISKASGLAVALAETGIAAAEVVGIGDAENDREFLAACGCAVAVANALAELKARCDLVTVGETGAGVVELIDRMLAGDLPARARSNAR